MKTNLELLLECAAEIIPAEHNTYFRVGGVEIATSGGQVAGIDIGPQSLTDAYVNGLKPTAYARCGAFWKRAWIRRAKTAQDKAALRSFLDAYEALHGIKAGTAK